ncbi:MAG: sulfotransferase domain-containing protein [Bacteroidota bacterium]
MAANKQIEIFGFLWKKVVIASLLLLNGKHRFSKAHTICVFAQPRGGSTWISNLLLHIPRSVKVDEPLFRGKFRPDGEMPPAGFGKLNVLDDLNFYYHQPIPKGEDFEEAARFFERLFRLGYSSPYLYEETSLKQLFRPENVIFKFNEGNLLMEWLVHRFELTTIVLLRNPFAVVASQLSFYAFSNVTKADSYKLPDFRFRHCLDPYLDHLKGLRYAEEILAARWCIHYLAVSKTNDKWLTVYYEDVVTRPQEEIQRIFDYLKRPVPDTLHEDFYTPSFQGYHAEAYYRKPANSLESWRTILSKQQTDRIKRVLEDFKVFEYKGESML